MRWLLLALMLVLTTACDEPFTSPPGDGDENGMVSGVLDGGSDVLAAVHVGRER